MELRDVPGSYFMTGELGLRSAVAVCQFTAMETVGFTDLLLGPDTSGWLEMN